jgi:hypothetical protein
MWANGNFFLLSKTAYILLETLFMLPLMLEFDVWLRHMKFVRWVALNFAIMYNVAYFVIGGVWWYQIESPPDFK